MDKFVLSEEDIRELFYHPPSPPSAPPAQSPFPVQKASPQFPLTPDNAKDTPPSPFHRLPRSTGQSKQVPHPPRPAADYTPAKARYHSKRQRLVRALSMFAVSFFLSFGLLNGGTYGSRLTYWWETDIQGRDPVTPEELQQLTGQSVQDIPASTPAGSTTPGPTSPATATSPRLPATPVTLPANRLIIPKIGVDAPVIWNADPSNILGDLQKGVAHYKGTALPNKKNGNVFVTGHSSNYVWDRGQYNRVFANLDKLVAGDLIAVTTDSAEYIYKVKDSVVVRPQQTEVLQQTPTPILSLMTCVPVGTNLRRLVVRSDLLQVIPLTDTDRSIPL